MQDPIDTKNLDEDNATGQTVQAMAQEVINVLQQGGVTALAQGMVDLFTDQNRSEVSRYLWFSVALRQGKPYPSQPEFIEELMSAFWERTDTLPPAAVPIMQAVVSRACTAFCQQVVDMTMYQCRYVASVMHCNLATFMLPRSPEQEDPEASSPPPNVTLH